MSIDLKFSTEQLPEGRAVIVEVCENNVVIHSFRARVGVTYGPDDKPGVILDNFNKKISNQTPPQGASQRHLSLVK